MGILTASLRDVNPAPMQEVFPHWKIARVYDTLAGAGTYDIKDWTNDAPGSDEMVIADCCFLSYHLEVTTAHPVSLRIRLGHGGEAAPPVVLYDFRMLLLLPGRRNVVDRLKLPSVNCRLSLDNSHAVDDASIIGTIKLSTM